MAIALMTAVWKLEIAATEKMVMLALADWANEQGQCWPSMAQLAKKSGLTDRSLRAIVGRLVEAKLLTRVENVGKGVFYTIHPGTCCPPEAASPRNETSQTPEAASANTSVTIITSEAKASSGPREPTVRPIAKPKSPKLSFVPDDWQPRSSHVEKAQSLGVDLRAEIERFRLHEFKVPKTDFDRAFHTWLINAPKYGPRHDRPDHRTAKSDHLSAVARAMAAACNGAEGEYRPDRPDPRPAGPMLVGFAEPGGHLRGVG